MERRERERFRQLSPDEREATSGCEDAGTWRRRDRTHARSSGTISRERGRDAAGDGTYESQAAQLRHARRRGVARDRRKLVPRGALWGAVATMLSWKTRDSPVCTRPRCEAVALDPRPEKGAAPATLRTRSPTVHPEFRTTTPSDGSNSKFHVRPEINCRAAFRRAFRLQYGPSR